MNSNRDRHIRRSGQSKQIVQKIITGEIHTELNRNSRDKLHELVAAEIAENESRDINLASCSDKTELFKLYCCTDEFQSTYDHALRIPSRNFDVSVQRRTKGKLFMDLCHTYFSTMQDEGLTLLSHKRCFEYMRLHKQQDDARKNEFGLDELSNTTIPDGMIVDCTKEFPIITTFIDYEFKRTIDLDKKARQLTFYVNALRQVSNRPYFSAIALADTTVGVASYYKSVRLIRMPITIEEMWEFTSFVERERRARHDINQFFDATQNGFGEHLK